ncbi:glycosyltransferase family 1 protein [Trametes sanguinea]|nr:glycosyltransferase family 1 protein [Trametes sanguinea]
MQDVPSVLRSTDILTRYKRYTFTMTVKFYKHILIGSAHMWGHARALAVLAGRMVRLRPMVVTFPAAANVYDRLKAEIVSDFKPEEKEALSRIRLIRIEQGTELLDPAVLRDNFLNVWNRLCSGESVDYETPDGKQGSMSLRDEPLSAVAIDGFTVELFNALYKQRETTPELASLKIYTFFPCSNSHILLAFRDDLIPLAEAIAEREGISFNDAAYKVWAVPKGRVIHSASLPPMFDYELDPQGLPSTPEMCGRLFVRVSRMLQQTDGFITIDAADYHPEATAAFRKWFGETGRKMYCAGPLISSGRDAPGFQAQGDAKDITKFLDAQLSSRGARSVVYVSFGSMLWPMDPAKLSAAFDVLIQQNIPFVMASPSPFAKLSQAVIDKVKEYPGAFVANWMPQQLILDHPAIGWCLTHGGHNSVLECINAGVPMIFWPVAADQPANAIHLTEQLEVAYELLEVRTGIGLAKIYRTGYTPVGTVDAVRAELRDVLARAFGADGEAKRAKMQGLRETLGKAWKKDGIARQEVEAFLDDACAGIPVKLVPAQAA